MSKETNYFYNTQAWKRTASAYAKSQQNLCEICRDQGMITPGEFVHHKIFLSPENIDDPSISLAWENLQLLCRKHHAEAHRKGKRRYKIDETGHVIVTE